MHRDAVISDCGQFRYILRRSWDISRPALGFVMLNPSTADASEDDPTIRKCIGFAERMGYGAIVVTNLYAFRSTDPRDLKRAGYLRGPECDEWLLRAAREASLTICAWGAHARDLSRPIDVINMLSGEGIRLRALAYTEDGIPRHPLMLPYACALKEVTA